MAMYCSIKNKVGTKNMPRDLDKEDKQLADGAPTIPAKIEVSPKPPQVPINRGDKELVGARPTIPAKIDEDLLEPPQVPAKVVEASSASILSPLGIAPVSPTVAPVTPTRSLFAPTSTHDELQEKFSANNPDFISTVYDYEDSIDVSLFNEDDD